MKGKKNTVVCLALTALLFTNLTGCRSDSQGDVSVTPPEQEVLNVLPGDISFATYREVPVNLNPSLKNYQVAPDLSNVTNRAHFKFSDKARSLIVKNGFVVIPGDFCCSRLPS